MNLEKAMLSTMGIGGVNSSLIEDKLRTTEDNEDNLRT